jgi:transposase InsO family protein
LISSNNALTIHHSDAGSQYTSMHLTETLQLHSLRPSIGTAGDAHDNARWPRPPSGSTRPNAPATTHRFAADP